MSAVYVVTADAVQALIRSGGEETHRTYYFGSPLPTEIDQDQLDMWIREGLVQKRDVSTSAAAEDAGEWKGPKGVKIDAVVAYVGDDPDRAADVLEQEEAGDNRPSLIKKLEAILDPSTD